MMQTGQKHTMSRKKVVTYDPIHKIIRPLVWMGSIYALNPSNFRVHDLELINFRICSIRQTRGCTDMPVEIVV